MSRFEIGFCVVVAIVLLVWNVVMYRLREAQADASAHTEKATEAGHDR